MNGKSFLKNLMGKAFGEKLHREPLATFLTAERPSADRPNPDLMDVRSVRSLFTSEPQAGKKINTGFVKFLTGRDPVRIRTLHSSTYIEYVPRFLVTLLCNAIPKMEGGDDDIRGIWRRLKIIHFGTIFTENPSPDRPHEKLADATLGERAESWGPEFMLMLMEIYATYVHGGCHIHVPRSVELNVQEQKDENSPFPMWLEDNAVRTTGARVHVHRFERSFAAGTHQPSAVALLRTMGYKVGDADKASRKKDPGCCNNNFRVVHDVNVRGWDEKEKRVITTVDSEL